MSSPRLSIVLPTWQGERDLERLLPALAAQEIAGSPPGEGFEVLAVDSSSTDRSRALLERAGARVERIEKSAFRHGATRNQAARAARGEFLVFLSQDALPRDKGFLAALVAPFVDPRMGGVYARILPHEDDDPLTARTVLSAPEASAEGETREIGTGSTLAALDDSARARLCGFNDVASAIRRSAFEAIPFPDVEFGEDVAWAARALEAGWKIRFEPRAVVYHSHRYSPSRAYRRYRVDADFHRRQFQRRLRPNLASVARGVAYEVREDWRHVARHGGFAHLLRSPFLRAAQVLGQYAGSRA
ncbi:MAG: glycosyltransferase family 2 protein [Planctomycetota bacterium]